MLGYANPDLTLHASQVRDWYGSEDGLDLRALDADCAALESAVAATEDALARQDDQLGALSAVWQGRSSGSVAGVPAPARRGIGRRGGRGAHRGGRAGHAAGQPVAHRRWEGRRGDLRRRPRT